MVNVEDLSFEVDGKVTIVAGTPSWLEDMGGGDQNLSKPLLSSLISQEWMRKGIHT